MGAQRQAQHVFLHGNGLPGRWAGRAKFVILETGFGLGHNFIATWLAWRADPSRCERLCFVSIERHPPTREQLQQAHAGGLGEAGELAQQLMVAWPALTPNLHLLDFEQGRLQLLLALGDVTQLLPVLQLQADAFYLDGFAPARNPQMWEPRVLKALGRKAAPGATLATWTAASGVRAGLVTAGFDVRLAAGTGGKRDITHAVHVRRDVRRDVRTNAASAPQASPGQALVIGAGLAGAAVARALAALGVAVTVLDRHAQPASETSGNPAGLFHGTLDPDDSPYARLFRAAAMQAARDYAPACRDDPQLGSVQGLLRLEASASGPMQMQALLQRQHLPPDWVQALDQPAAAALAACELPSPAWYYPGGGWISPARWVQHALAAPGITVRCGVQVQRIQHLDGIWHVLNAQGDVIARAPCLVLANAAGAAELLTPWLPAVWPLQASAGQVSWLQADGGAPRPKLPVAGDGYAIPLPDGGLLFGATRQMVDVRDIGVDMALSAEDHDHNLQRLQRLLGWPGVPAAGVSLQGRRGWRLHADDRLPIAGALPLPVLPQGHRADQVRLLPRVPGLFVLTALGARGLTLAPLLGRLVAAQVTGTPWPLEQDLADAVDPGRWRVREARRRAADGLSEAQPG